MSVFIVFFFVPSVTTPKPEESITDTGSSVDPPIVKPKKRRAEKQKSAERQSEEKNAVEDSHEEVSSRSNASSEENKSAVTKKRTSDVASVKNVRPPIKTKDADAVSIASTVKREVRKPKPATSQVASEEGQTPRTRTRPDSTQRAATFAAESPQEEVVVKIPKIRPAEAEGSKGEGQSRRASLYQGIKTRIRKMSERFWVQKEWEEGEDGASYMLKKGEEFVVLD